MKVIIVAIASSFLIVIALIVTAPHWWKKFNDAKVTHNGLPSVETSVYRSRTGDLLVKDGTDMYFIQLETNRIGMANRSNFFILPGYAYSKNLVPPFALMNPVKSTAPELVVQQESVEFNSMDNGRIRITW